MILFVEPISKNTDMYVPAYPLLLPEIACLLEAYLPGVEIQIVSTPVDHGLPLTGEGKTQTYEALIRDPFEVRPTGKGISRTGTAQAQEVIHLYELVKQRDPSLFIFLSDYFPTIYRIRPGQRALQSILSIKRGHLVSGERPL